MLFFHKLLPVFFLPTGLVCLLLFFALFAKKSRAGLIAAALALLYFASTDFVASAIAGRLENRYPPQSIAGCGPADAVIVLGGIVGGNRPGLDFPSWSGSVNRFMVGVALMRAGKAGNLVFSRASIPSMGLNATEGDILETQAIAAGVPPEKIVLTPPVRDTADEARAAADLCRGHGWKHVVLVTSAWHMPRAAWLFQRAGVSFTPFPVDFQTDPLRRLTLLNFLPNARSLEMTEWALREDYGLVYYVVFGPA